jgi:hypothetical protein
MMGQYEQQCNAAALKSMGIHVLKKFKNKYAETIAEWIESDYRIEINYPDITGKIISRIFETHVQKILKDNKWDKEYRLSFPEELREKIREKATI